MSLRILAPLVLAVGAGALLAKSSPAVQLSIDYSFDTSDFFGAGNPDGPTAGAQARSALEAAADFYSDLLTDSFSSIQAPEPFVSSQFTGTVFWRWQPSFFNPTTGLVQSLADPVIAQDEFRIYVGARALGGSTAGVGGGGGSAWSNSSNGGFFSSEEVAQIDAISVAFAADVENRGGPESEYSNWGGSVSFDNDGTTNWHFDHTTDPGRGQVDLFTVALHELGHTLGIGTSQQWDQRVVNGVFTGQAAFDANGGAFPAADTSHWDPGLVSTVLGGFTQQTPLLGPTILGGQRSQLTTLDAAGLTDIGWSVAAPPVLPGDYNLDGVVNAADFTVWRDALNTDSPIGSYQQWLANFGATIQSAASGAPVVAAVPEPTASVLLLGFVGSMAIRARRRRPLDSLAC